MKNELKFKVWDATNKEYIKGDFSLGVESGEVRGKYGEVFKDLEIHIVSEIKEKDNG